MLCEGAGRGQWRYHPVAAPVLARPPLFTPARRWAPLFLQPGDERTAGRSCPIKYFSLLLSLAWRKQEPPAGNISSTVNHLFTLFR